MKKIIYVSDSYSTGGTELYIFRLFKMAYGQFELHTFLLNDTEINDECRSELIKYDVKIHRIKEKIFGYEYDEEIKKKFLDDDVIIFSTSLRCYVACLFFSEKSKNDNNIYSFLYVLHQEGALSFSYDTYMKKNNYKFKKFLVECARIIMILPFKNVIASLIENKNIIFMDEQTYSNTLKVYGIKKKIVPKIIRLGVEIENWSENYRKEFMPFNILTITRFDFPFKGYVQGLLEDYIILKKKYPNMTLTMIGDGEGSLLIDKRINQLDEEIKQSIKWIKHLDFKELHQYFLNAHVYVGMGTTILNAAQYGIPCILASAYQTANFASGFFHNNPFKVGVSVDEEDGQKYIIKELIENVFNLNRDEYKKISKMTYKVYEENYNIRDAYLNLFTTKGKYTDVYRNLHKIIIIKKILKK